MQRCAFLTQATLGSTAAVALGSRPADGQTTSNNSTDTLPVLRWRMVTSWPKKLDILFGGAETICRTKPVGKGTGLGLSISHQIVVEKHNGELCCESTVGQGTQFLIKIPSSPEDGQDIAACVAEPIPLGI